MASEVVAHVHLAAAGRVDQAVEDHQVGDDQEVRR